MLPLSHRIKALRSQLEQCAQGEDVNSPKAVGFLIEISSLLDELSQELIKNTEADRLLITQIEKQSTANAVDFRQKIWVLLGLIGAIAALLLRIDPTTEFGQKATESVLNLLINLMPVVLASLGIAMAVNQRK